MNKTDEQNGGNPAQVAQYIEGSIATNSEDPNVMIPLIINKFREALTAKIQDSGEIPWQWIHQQIQEFTELAKEKKWPPEEGLRLKREMIQAQSEIIIPLAIDLFKKEFSEKIENSKDWIAWALQLSSTPFIKIVF